MSTVECRSTTLFICLKAETLKPKWTKGQHQNHSKGNVDSDSYTDKRKSNSNPRSKGSNIATAAPTAATTTAAAVMYFVWSFKNNLKRRTRWLQLRLTPEGGSWQELYFFALITVHPALHRHLHGILLEQHVEGPRVAEVLHWALDTCQEGTIDSCCLTQCLGLRLHMTTSKIAKGKPREI